MEIIHHFLKIYIQNLFWIYFFFLLFEGAFRKWFLPELSQGLLIVRDPIVIWIYFLAYSQGLFPIDNKYIQKCFLWNIIALIISFSINQTYLFTMLYGARTNLLHFPLIFITLIFDPKVISFIFFCLLGNL